MKIEILGAGCAKCDKTAGNVRLAVTQSGIPADVIHVTDIKTIMEKDVMQTPAVIIDGTIVLQGKVPTVEQMTKLVETFARKN
jgi:small redox-active disulfide protein 2